MRAFYLLVVVSLLMGCSASGRQIPSSAVGRYNFNYLAQKQEGINLIQVFDSGDETFLHFLSLKDLPTPKVFSGLGSEELKYRIENNFLVLNEIHDWLLIVVGEKEAFVQRELAEEAKSEG